MLLFFSVVNVITLSSISAPQTTFVPLKVNRPFVFYIINRLTKTALFSGQVYNINPTTTPTNTKNMPQDSEFRIPLQTNTINPTPNPQKKLFYQQPQPMDSQSVFYPINMNQKN